MGRKFKLSRFVEGVFLLSMVWMVTRNFERLHFAVFSKDNDGDGEKSFLPSVIPVQLQSTLSPQWDFCGTNSTSIRCQPIPLAQTKFSYVHISKNSGVSWIRELKKLKRLDQWPSKLPGKYQKMAKVFPKTGLYPVADSGAEHGVPWQDSLLEQHRPFHRLITLRSPRHQIWSMFRHCYYSSWGKKATAKDPHFPTSHRNDSDDLIDFELWLHEFLDDTKEQFLDEAGALKRNYSLACYHPQNFQARFLASNIFSPRQPSRGVIEPNLRRVENTYWSFDFVALTSFFHESKCLFYHRLDTQGAPQEVSQMVSDYLNKTCHCNVAGEDGGDQGMDIKEAHSKKGKRSTLLDLPARILRKMDILSRIDTAIYQTALDQFVTEIVWLESQLERRVLCDPVLDKWGKELSYLSLLQEKTLSDSYHERRRSASLEL
jgi:hypothetical protein